MRISCYGAVGEIGGNKLLLEDSESTLMLDFGKSFTAESGYFDEYLKPRTNSALRDLLSLGLLPAIEGIYRHDLLSHAGAWSELRNLLPESARRLFEYDLPSYRQYLDRHERARVDGVLLSHAHADHAQHIAFLDPQVPVCCSAATRAILQAVQDTGQGGYESDLLECPERRIARFGPRSTFPNDLDIERCRDDCARKIETLRPYEQKHIGGFKVTSLPVDHSVPGACSYLIEGPSGKRVFYTGDVRFHGRYSTPPNDLTSALREATRGLRPDVVITEGTRIESSSGDSEADVEQAIAEDIGGCTGLAIVSFGWKDTTRFVSVLNAAKACGRLLAVSPKTLYLWNLLHAQDADGFPELSREHVRAFLGRTESMLYSRSDYTSKKHEAGINLDWGNRGANLLGLPESAENPYLCHYYGGVRAYEIAEQPSKYVLHAGFFDMNDLLDCAPPQGSVFIKAETEPFNDDMRIDEQKLERWLVHFGILSADRGVPHHHVSGHANGPDLLEFISEMKPALVIPIHTEKPELFQSGLDGMCEVIPPRLGEPIEIR